MSKPPGSATAAAMTLGLAVRQWTEAHPEKKIEDETHVKLTCTTPPIDRIDNTVNLFTNCIKLSLSTNMIDKIPLLPGNCMCNLRILSLGRNQIKKITGLEEIGATLKELWISYNQISTLDGLSVCTQLETLLISNNKIKETSEIRKLMNNPNLVNCNFIGNPIYEGLSRSDGRMQIIQALPQLKTLDGELITESIT